MDEFALENLKLHSYDVNGVQLSGINKVTLAKSYKLIHVNTGAVVMSWLATPITHVTASTVSLSTGGSSTLSTSDSGVLANMAARITALESLSLASGQMI